MAVVTNVLVVAGEAAVSVELLEAMLSEAQRGPSVFTLVVPRGQGPREAMNAALRFERVVARAGDAGLWVSGRFGDSDPVIAAVENFNPRRIDRIIVCTLPAGLSRWCAADALARVRRLTGAVVVLVRAAAPTRAAQLEAGAA